MNILVLSDIHSSLDNLKKLVEKAEEELIDLVVIAGDLTNFGDENDTEKVLNILSLYKILAIPGNLDTPMVIDVLEENNQNLHDKKIKQGKWTFAGFGGSLMTRPGKVLVTEEQIMNSLKKNASGESLILVTHMPPKNTKLDHLFNGEHGGSESVKKIIKDRQPEIHLCGHIHEAYGEEKIGKTLSINIGAVKDGRALMLYLGDKIKIKRLDLNGN